MITLHKIDKKALTDEHKIIILGVVTDGDIPCHGTLFYNLEEIPSGIPKLVDGKIVPATKEDLYNWGIITLEDIRNELRLERAEAFKTMFIYDIAVLNGDKEQTKEEKEQRNIFRKQWLDLPNRLNESNVFLIKRPIMPDFISYFNQYKGGVY